MPFPVVCANAGEYSRAKSAREVRHTLVFVTLLLSSLIAKRFLKSDSRCVAQAFLGVQLTESLYRIVELYLVAENVLKIQRQAVQSSLCGRLSADDLENSPLHRCRHLCGFRYCRFRSPNGNAGQERGSVGKSDDCRVIISRCSNG